MNRLRRLKQTTPGAPPPPPPPESDDKLFPVAAYSRDASMQSIIDMPSPPPDAEYQTRQKGALSFARFRSGKSASPQSAKSSRSRRSKFSRRIKTFFETSSRASQCSSQSNCVDDDVPSALSDVDSLSPQRSAPAPPIAPADRDALVYGTYVECGANCAPGRCNDGYLSFVMPDGWLARRVKDGFMLFNGLAVGFAMAVQARDATKVLLETGRLQVMSEVSALSSPVFVSHEQVRVLYSSFEGAGIG